MARPKKETVVTEEITDVVLPTDEETVVTEDELIATREKLSAPLVFDEAKLNISTERTAHEVAMSDTVLRYYPRLEGMPSNAVMKATINEFEFSVPRDKEVQVPKIFAEIFDRIRVAETGANIRKDLLHDRANPIIN